MASVKAGISLVLTRQIYPQLLVSYCGGVKWSAPEKSPDPAYAEYPYGSGRVWAIVIPAPGISCILG
jgi:hypothetical protein